MSREAERQTALLKELVRGLVDWIPSVDRRLGRLDVAISDDERVDILESSAAVIGPDGSWCRSFPIQFRSIHIANFAADALTLTTGGAGGTVPTIGAGVMRVPALSARTVGLRGNTVNVFGTPNDSFDITVYRRVMPPSFASI
jgi:hypothetical protein